MFIVRESPNIHKPHRGVMLAGRKIVNIKI